MRILLDENLPRDLVAELAGHHITTVQAVGWSGTSNGELLRRARGRFDVLMTMDRRLPHQHDLQAMRISVLVVRAPSNRMAHLKPLVSRILMALGGLRPGQVREVGSTVGPGARGETT